MNSELRYWGTIALLLAAASGLHVMSHGGALSARYQLSNFPFSVGSWSGRELPIKPEELKAVGVDDYLFRIYVSPEDGPVIVYVGYYKSQRAGQLIHSPKNCLPGNGWQPVSAGRTELVSSNGLRVPANLYIVEKGLNRTVVLYWYQSHGRIIASEYWAKFYMILDAIRMNRTDAALVRVSTPLDTSEPASLGRAQHFATQLLANLDQYLPR